APAERRTLMFSATVSKEIAGLATDFQRDALRIQTAGEARQHVDIEYRALSVAVRDREHAIFNALRFYEARTAIVFCKTRANVNHLLARMGNRGFQVVALSGELSQQERTHALQALRDGRARVCIATDVAARGIDLPGLELVIHADLPSNSETLLHRSGRTGRAGRKGVSALIVTPPEFRKAQRLLQGAKVVAEWGNAPSADDVQAKDDARLLEHGALMAPVGEEAGMARAILERYDAETVAAAFVRLWREGRSAPEVLSDQAAPGAAPAPRERGEFGASVWFALSVGRSGRAEARWLLPKICDAGGISKDGIGAIRVQEDQTFVQIAEGLAPKFGATMELESGVVMTRLAGEPSLDRPERAPARAPRAAPRAAGEREEKPAPRPKADKPAYVPKAPRVVEEVAKAPAVEVVAERAAPERKPYVKREAAPEPKPETPREAAPERKPYVAREGAPERKAYAPREGAPERKAYAKREDGDRKPYAPREAAAGAKPYAKPYAPREEGAPKPRWKAEEKAAPRSAGFKSHGSADKPGRATGYKSHAAEGTGFKPRVEGDRDGKPAARTYAPKTEGAEARPYVKKPYAAKPGAAGKAGGFKSHAAEGTKPFARAKPAAPKVDAKDTSKRFVPPKKKG
ncbi:MAG: helicase-related protein, partial [Novosphingobium sp.]